MASIWTQSTQPPHCPVLPGDKSADAVVIGGGMAGILTAYQLKEAGVEAVVLEADRVGSGQTQNTTAKITSQHGPIYARLLRQLGAEGAGQYARANQRAIGEYRRIVRDLGVDCALEERPACLYSVREEEPLREEARAQRALGLPAEFTTRTGLPFPVKGAVRLEGQAQFHPLLFLNAAAEQVQVYEQTRVLRVEGDRVETERGTVRAKHIVFACHFPFVNAPGYYFLRMHQERSYVLALEGPAPLDGMYYSIDPEGLSLRTSGPYLLVGGGAHRTGENSAGGKYATLRQAAKAHWPEAREQAHWSAQDCIPLDGVPYIGRFAPSAPNWYVATGFQKWGMTSSMVSAMLITALITGHEDPDGAVFSPRRFRLGAAAANLLEDGTQSVKGLSRQLFARGRAALADLPPGHGGVVELDGEKVGGYRREDGELFLISTRCPHLGCQLEWNPDEHSWDCPCHGSRFDYQGRLLTGPAQTGLKGPD